MKLKPSIRLSSRRSKLAALAAAGTAALGMVSFAVAQPAAHADPIVTYAGTGSDTTQDVMNQFAADGNSNLIGSFNAVNPVTATAHEIISYGEGKHGVNCSFTRPNGSTEGKNAFRKSINQSTTAAQLASPPQANCLDFSRSSSGPGSDQKNDGQLVWIPFAIDAVSTATGGTSNIPAADANALTKTQLSTLYASCGAVTVNGHTYTPDTNINLYVPQNGSGTLSFWQSTLGIPTPLPACDHQTILAGPNSGASVEEHDGTAVNSDPNGMMPFSIAQWISQSNGNNDRRHGAVLHEVNSIFPCTGNSLCPAAGGGTLNSAFPITREVFNIVQFNAVVNSAGDTIFDANLAGQFAGAGSALCQDTFTITGFGFATDPNCGSTANNFRGFDASDPV